MYNSINKLTKSELGVSRSRFIGFALPADNIKEVQILGMISHFELQNVIIIVVRYFGGVKLGVRGLIDAYGRSARIAIERAEIVKRQQMERVKICLPYSLYDTLKHEIEIIGGALENPVFEKNIICEINLPKENTKIFVDELSAKGVKIIVNE